MSSIKFLAPDTYDIQHTLGGNQVRYSTSHYSTSIEVINYSNRNITISQRDGFKFIVFPTRPKNTDPIGKVVFRKHYTLSVDTAIAIRNQLTLVNDGDLYNKEQKRFRQIIAMLDDPTIKKMDKNVTVPGNTVGFISGGNIYFSIDTIVGIQHFLEDDYKYIAQFDLSVSCLPPEKAPRHPFDTQEHIHQCLSEYVNELHPQIEAVDVVKTSGGPATYYSLYHGEIRRHVSHKPTIKQHQTSVSDTRPDGIYLYSMKDGQLVLRKRYELKDHKDAGLYLSAEEAMNNGSIEYMKEQLRIEKAKMDQERLEREEELARMKAEHAKEEHDRERQSSVWKQVLEGFKWVGSMLGVVLSIIGLVRKAA